MTVNGSALVERSGVCAGGIVLAGPDPAARRVLELGNVRRALERLVAERRAVGVVDRRLERRSRDVAVEHARVRVVEDRRLDAAAEQRLGLAHEVLVERVLRGDEHREPVAAPARAAPLLAQARDRAREADGDRAVEQADVDAELERVGRRDAEQLALDEAPLDVASLLRRVAGAVRREPLRRLRVDAVGRHAVDELGRLAALREADRAQVALHERWPAGARRRRARSRAGRARRRAARGSTARSSAPRAALRRRRSTVALVAEQRVRELAGVRDRRRREHELRLGAVDAGEPPQPAQDVGDVRAEDAAIDVRLVDRRRSGGCAARPPRGRGAAARRRGACRGS